LDKTSKIVKEAEDISKIKNSIKPTAKVAPVEIPVPPTLDQHNNIISNGDNVRVTKTQKCKGMEKLLRRNTILTNARVTENPQFIMADLGKKSLALNTR